MHYEQLRPAVSCHRTALLVLIITTLGVIFILRISITPSSGQQLSTVYATFVDVTTKGSGNSSTTLTIIPPPEGPTVNKIGRYVSMCQRNFDSRRLGNQLFNFAAMLHVARLTGRRVATLYRHPFGWLDRFFQVSVTRVHNINTELCPCLTVRESDALSYYHKLVKLTNDSSIVGKSLLICGYFQGWKYTVGVESELRHQLRLHPRLFAAVHNYLDQILPSNWKGQSFRRIGIHVRAGDLFQRYYWEYGYTVPQRPYFEQAMAYFIIRQPEHEGRVQFIVTSDSLSWAKKNINLMSIAHQLNGSTLTKNPVLVDLVHSEDHDAAFDFAVLTLCDGVIMSTGTYGWWAGWLANKTTIYYSNWPRVGTSLFRGFDKEDFFPPNWIPMDGPEFPCCESV